MNRNRGSKSVSASRSESQVQASVSMTSDSVGPKASVLTNKSEIIVQSDRFQADRELVSAESSFNSGIKLLALAPFQQVVPSWVQAQYLY